jgi:hypothetical protein
MIEETAVERDARLVALLRSLRIEAEAMAAAGKDTTHIDALIVDTKRQLHD